MSGAVQMPDFCSRKNPFHYVTALNTLGKMGVDPNDVTIIAVGEYWNYRGEVIEQEPAAGSSIGRSTGITLKVGYNSAIDYMPYQFFYGFGDKPPRGSDWDMNARKLMAPFDASVIRADARAKFLSLVFGFGLVDSEYISRFLNLYDFGLEGQAKDMKDLLFWVALMPAFHNWAGNPNFLAAVVTSLLGYPCCVKENVRSEHQMPPPDCYRLGDGGGRLGAESVIGRSFSECDTAYEVQLSGIRENDLSAFLPGGAKMQMLEDILDFCMPNNYDYIISVHGEERGARIGADGANCYLGMSSYI